MINITESELKQRYGVISLERDRLSDEVRNLKARVEQLEALNHQLNDSLNEAYKSISDAKDE